MLPPSSRGFFHRLMRRRRGHPIFEFLFPFSIILVGLLVALILPVVQWIRDLLRQTLAPHSLNKARRFQGHPNTSRLLGSHQAKIWRLPLWQFQPGCEHLPLDGPESGRFRGAIANPVLLRETPAQGYCCVSRSDSWITFRWEPVPSCADPR